MTGIRPYTVSTWIALGIRVAVTILFMWAGGVKLLDPEAFARSIQGYQLIPDAVIVRMAWVLPWLELWCAIGLWIKVNYRGSAWCWILIMLVVFTGAKASAVLRGLDISCGCTGSGTPLSWNSVLENLGWIVVTSLGFWLDVKMHLSSKPQ